MREKLKIETAHTVELGRMRVSRESPLNIGYLLFDLAGEMHTCREVIGWIYDQLPKTLIYFEPDLTCISISIKARFGDHAEATAFKLRWQS